MSTALDILDAAIFLFPVLVLLAVGTALIAGTRRHA